MRWILVLAVAWLTLPAAEAQAIHPEIALLDDEGESVLRTGMPISPGATCGECHDTAYIEEHGHHVWLRPSPANPDGFDPIRYDALPPTDPVALENWMHRHGGFHVGGGFARGLPDGGVEMDCFLCHARGADALARAAELHSGDPRWSATATLARLGLAQPLAEGWSYLPEAFEADGTVATERLELLCPTTRHCGACHGPTWEDAHEALVQRPDRRHPQVERTGELFAPGRIRDSGMSIEGKDALHRPWDVHAARLLDCVDCHPSVENPGSTSGPVSSRRLDFGEYLERPSHELVGGGSLRDPGRGCVACHDPTTGHDWLPQRDRHLQRLACESCHIPRLWGTARGFSDWTLLDAHGRPIRGYRGADADPTLLRRGYRPLLLPRLRDGREQLTPHNLIAAWYWVEAESGELVPRRRLERALLQGQAHRPELVGLLDRDGDGRLGSGELRLVEEEQVAAVRALLVAAGASDPRIVARLHAGSLHHGVATGEFALRECRQCHAESSRLSRPMGLAPYLPGGVLPEDVIDGGRVEWAGDALLFRPEAGRAGLFLPGHSHRAWVDVPGSWAVVFVLVGILIHGGTRLFLFALRRRRER